MNDTVLTYTRHLRRQTLIIIVLILLLAAGMVISLSIGPVRVSLFSLLRGADSTALQVFMSIRLPRVLAALLAGAGLSVSGLAIQNVLRNPLASPYTLGISGAAAFGAALSIVLIGASGILKTALPAMPFTMPMVTGLGAFLFSLLSVAIIIGIMKKMNSRPAIIVLAGIMISSLFGACTSALQFFVNDRQLAEIIFWTFGDPGRAGYVLLLVQSLVILPVLLWMERHTWDFALLQTGDDSAKAGGLDPARFRFKVLVLASMMTSVIVAGYGIIGYVGLVAPHICRNFVRGHYAIFLTTGLFGGLFLLLSDALGRLILQPVILPVGIITALCGAPFFIVMLLRNKGIK